MSASVDHWRIFWLLLALALGAVVAVSLYAFLGTFVSGVFLYYASRPMYDRVRKRMDSPNLAAATALFLLVLPAVLLFWYAAGIALGQVGALTELDLSEYQGLVAPYVEFIGDGTTSGLYERLVTNPTALLESGQFRDAVRQVALASVDFLGVFVNVLLRLFLAVSVAFYLLRDDERLIGWVQETVGNETLTEYGRNVDADLQTVFFGNILTALLTGVIGAVVFWLLARVVPPEIGFPVPILLGLLVGATSLVPIVGMKIVLLPMTLYFGVLAVVTDPGLLWFPVVFFAVTTVFVDFIPDLLLRPYVSGRDLHIGLVMFAYILGPLLFGWYGLFLGPLLLVLVIHFAGIVVPELVASAASGNDDESTTHSPRLRSGASSAGRDSPGKEE
jgi:predicted PurR-regulated permease PerM